MEATFVGLNATSEMIEVAIRPTGENWKRKCADDTIYAVASDLKRLQPELVVMEAMGTFELPMAGVLATQGLPFAIVNPRTVRDFARAIGRVSRADHSQAGLLAHFAELVQLEPRPLSNDVVQKLRDLRGRREDVMKMMDAERRRLVGTALVVRGDVQRHIQFLEKSLATLDEEFNKTIRFSSAWR